VALLIIFGLSARLISSTQIALLSYMHACYSLDVTAWMSRVPLVLPLLLIGFRSIPFFLPAALLSFFLLLLLYFLSSCCCAGLGRLDYPGIRQRVHDTTCTKNKCRPFVWVRSYTTFTLQRDNHRSLIVCTGVPSVKCVYQHPLSFKKTDHVI
jgi:hypothetical protein